MAFESAILWDTLSGSLMAMTLDSLWTARWMARVLGYHRYRSGRAWEHELAFSKVLKMMETHLAPLSVS
jgi:hypothetical protein